MKILKSISLGLMVFSVSGCSVLGMGKSDFSCPGMPTGVMCKSTKEVYGMTNGNIRGEPLAVSPVGVKNHDEWKKNAKGERIDGYDETGKPYVLNINRLPTRPMQEKATGVQPILEPAKVVRIWVGPWRDRQNNLIFPTYLYANVADRVWSVRGADFEGANRVLTPVQVRSYESSEATEEEPSEQ